MDHKIIVRFFVIVFLLLPQSLLASKKYIVGSSEAREAIVKHFEKNQDPTIQSPSRKIWDNEWPQLRAEIENGNFEKAKNIFDTYFKNSAIQTRGNESLLFKAQKAYNTSLSSSKPSKKSTKATYGSKSENGNLFDSEYKEYQDNGSADESYAEKNLTLETIVKKEKIPERIYFYDSNKAFYQFTNFWSKHPIKAQDKTWQTSEHFFQANKFEKNSETYKKILNEQYAGNVFKLGKTKGSRTDWHDPYKSSRVPQNCFAPPNVPALDLSNEYATFLKAIVNNCKKNTANWKSFKKIKKTLEKEWSTTKVAVMYYIVKEKFTQHPDLKQLLIDTGDKILVEDSFKDNYWGIYIENPNKFSPNIPGLNMLGIILMHVRKELNGGASSFSQPMPTSIEGKKISEEEEEEETDEKLSNITTSKPWREIVDFLGKNQINYATTPQNDDDNIDEEMYTAIDTGDIKKVENLFKKYFSSPSEKILDQETNDQSSLIEIATRVLENIKINLLVAGAEEAEEEIVEKTKPKSTSQDPLSQSLTLLKAKLLSLAKNLSPEKEKSKKITGKKFDLSQNTIYITLVEGDITKQQFVNNDKAAIVNAANSGQIGSAGVAYHIQQAAGDEQFKNYIKSNFFDCPTGEARLMPSLGIANTGGPAFIINTVGPNLTSQEPTQKDKEDLESAITQSLTLADKGQNTPNWLKKTADQFHTQKQTITAVAFPAISAGIFGYYSNLSAPVVINAMIDYLKNNKNTNLREIRFVTFDGYQERNDYQNYADALNQSGDLVQTNFTDDSPLSRSLKKSENNSKKPSVIYTYRRP